MLSQVSEDSVYYLCMPDTLPKLLQEIHSVSTPSELNTRFSDFKSRIATILSDNPSQENYYKNHTGREFFRKLHNFGLSSLIFDGYDSGFRPTTIDGIISTGEGVQDALLTEDEKILTTESENPLGF